MEDNQFTPISTLMICNCSVPNIIQTIIQILVEHKFKILQNKDQTKILKRFISSLIFILRG